MNRAAKHFENHQRKYRKTDFILEASKKYYSREYSQTLNPNRHSTGYFNIHNHKENVVCVLEGALMESLDGTNKNTTCSRNIINLYTVIDIVQYIYKWLVYIPRAESWEERRM